MTTPVVTDPEVRAVLIEVLCSQALADHLGDVRDAERGLWKLLGVEVDHYNSEPGDENYWNLQEASQITRYRLKKHGLPAPEWFESDEAIL